MAKTSFRNSHSILSLVFSALTIMIGLFLFQGVTPASAQTIVDRHQALMWKVGDLMHQWEELQTTLASSQSA